MSRVLIAMDGSEYSEDALHFYLDLLHRPEDDVTILHCPELYDLSRNLANPNADLSYESFSRHIDDKQSEWSEVEDVYEEMLRERRVKYKFEVLPTSKPGEAIVRRSRDLTIDLIVMGSRGHGALGRALFGSVSDYVLHHSHVPVAIHRQPHHHHHQQQQQQHVYNQH